MHEGSRRETPIRLSFQLATHRAPVIACSFSFPCCKSNVESCSECHTEQTSWARLLLLFAETRYAALASKLASLYARAAGVKAWPGGQRNCSPRFQDCRSRPWLCRGLNCEARLLLIRCSPASCHKVVLVSFEGSKISVRSAQSEARC